MRPFNPRRAARRVRVLFRAVPVLRYVRPRPGAARFQPDQPAQPPEAAVVAVSVVPTISAATCCRAACMAPGCRSSSGFAVPDWRPYFRRHRYREGYLGGLRYDHATFCRRLDEFSRFDHPDRGGVGGRPRNGADHCDFGLLLGIAGSRIIRGAVLSVREAMYVHAAQSMGSRTTRILWRHILPNVMPPLIVLFTNRVGAVILAESGLSFLGFGVPPPAPTGAACSAAPAGRICIRVRGSRWPLAFV